MLKAKRLFERRKRRNRLRLRKVSSGRPRLSVFRSHMHIYAQIIDDRTGRTLAAASTVDKALRDKVDSGGNKAAAAEVGRVIAERSLEAGVKDIIFDRGGYLYHGRVKALAEAAREHGLKF
jgi:large subunit ribosomal protein L18